MVDTIEHHEMWTESIVGIEPAASSLIMTNNLTVCFIAFAGGIVFGLGAIWSMFFNGLLLGVIGVACQQHGMALDLWSFVAPHGSLELPSIILAGAAGLAPGARRAFPGLYRWRDSIALAGVEATRLVAGIIPLLIIAGTLEGFFSPSAAPVWLKFTVGGTLFTLLLVWLFRPVAAAEREGAIGNAPVRSYTIARSFTFKYWFSTAEVSCAGSRSSVSAPCSRSRASSSSRRIISSCAAEARNICSTFFGPRFGDGFHVGLRHGHKQQHMALQQLHGAVDHLGPHGGFRQVGDPQNQRPPRLPAVQRGRGAQMIGLAGLGARLRQRFDNLPQVRGAAAGQHALLHMLAVDEQAHAVAGVKRQLRQRHRGGAGVVELGVAAPLLHRRRPRRMRPCSSLPASRTIHTAWLRSVW